MISCVDCRKILEDDSLDRDRAAKLDAIQQDTFACEKCGASKGPGIVADIEVLYFVCFDPTQIFDDGTVRPTALMQVDLGGLSVLRERAGDDEFVLTVKQMSAKDDGRTLHGVAEFTAGNARYLNGARLMGIYDTPLEGKLHHADLLAPAISRDSGLSKTKAALYKKERLRKLSEVIGASTAAANFRGGVLVNAAAT